MNFSYHNEDSPWPVVAGVTFLLMLIFLFISIGYMTDTIQNNNKITAVADSYEKIQIGLTNDLKEEFTHNLKEWNATFDPSSLSIRFEYPEILFKVGSAELNEQFKTILNNFFPPLFANSE